MQGQHMGWGPADRTLSDKDTPGLRSEKAEHGLRDSGERHEFSTGASREPAVGKGRFDLIPPYPIRRLAQHYEAGAKKYADRNWEKGLPLDRFLDSAQRHFNDFLDGNREEDHLSAIMWNIAGFMHTEREILEGRLPGNLASGMPISYRNEMLQLLSSNGGDA